MKKNISGMRNIIHCIIFICSACCPTIWSRCWRIVISEYRMLATQKRIHVSERWSPMSHRLVFHSMMGSYVERSLIQRKLSPRS